jgi:ketosteroid isomerase-like protein
MSEEVTRTVVSRWFDALDAGDVDTAMACLDDNVRWINSPAEKEQSGGIPGLSAIIPWLGDFSNKVDVIATFGPWGERQETVTYECLNMMFKDDQALVLVHEAARIKATGLVYDVEFVQRIQVAGDVIVLLKAYWDTSQAVAAFRGDMQARLLEAARQGNTDEAELILPFGANPNQADPVSNESVLMIAAAGNHVEMVKMLLLFGAEPNLISRTSGNTALHTACRTGNPDLVKILLEGGAFVNVQCPTTGETPLEEVLQDGFLECAEILIEAGANKDAIAFDGGARTSRLVGHYKGFLDLSVIGFQRREEFQVLLNPGGTAIIVVDELPIEAESSALGTWKRVGPQMVKVGCIQFRTGEFLSARISKRDGGRNDNVSTCQIALEAMVDTKGNMTGKVLVEVVELDVRRFPNSENVPTSVPLLDVRRISLDDFTFPSHQKHTK